MIRVFVPAVVALGALALARPVAAVTDHLACFKVTDHAPRGKFAVTLARETGTIQCTVKAPAKVGCLEMSQDSITRTPPGAVPTVGSPPGNFLCYALKCAKSSPPSASFSDQFGSRTISFRGAQLLCEPATQTGGSAPVASTTTTTIAGNPSGCTFSGGQCTGTCGAGMRCGTSAANGCTCQAVTCGNASAPECNGSCGSGKACVLDPTNINGGCMCVTSSP